MKDLAIVLVSGGMDSLATLNIAQRDYEVALLHLNYGQKTQSKEMECFEKIADHYSIPNNRRKVIDMTFLSQIGGSSLTDDRMKPTEFDPDFEGVPTSYVPFRNTHIIAMAVSWAEIIGAKKIFIGAVEEDHMGYPDCRPSYYAAYNELIKQGTKEGDISIETPIIHMTKDKILTTINEAKGPIELTWSCYESGSKACGKCDSCGLRLQAFEKLGVKDPIEYQ